MYKFIRTGNKFIVSLDNHVSIMEALKAFCKENDIKSGSISGIGAVNEATFRYLNPNTMAYVDKLYEEQMELTAIEGNISRKDGQVYLHVHVTASRSDYSCVGGHLLDARISGACELFIEDYGLPVGRKADAETGINLYLFQ